MEPRRATDRFTPLRVRLALLVIVMGPLAIAVLLNPNLPLSTDVEPGSFAFAVLGDAPYFDWETVQFELVLDELDAHDLSSIIHVGDIFWQPCTDALYIRSLDWFNALRHAVVYTPGDNEWTDCWETGAGAFEPLGRLDRIREIFFAEPAQSLGGTLLPLVSQAGVDNGVSEFPENVRWSQNDVTFATVHLVGSWNALNIYPGRTEAHDDAARRRTQAAAAWVRETFSEANASDARAVVLGFHANPSFAAPVEDGYRSTYEPFIEALEEEVERFEKPVLVVHGDNPEFIVDHPLIRRTTGEILENLTRLQVPGSPDIGYVRVSVTPGENPTFEFNERVIPWWKYW